MTHPHARGFAVAVLACAALTVGAAAPAAAQEGTPVDGAADFRTAPLVGEGTFRDEIVTGETIWYSSLYTNDEDLRIAARLVDADADNSEELELERILIAPNLEVVSADIDDYDGSASYTGADTNLWFLAFRLNTTGQLGVLHELEFSLEGVGSANREPCGADCTLDEELAELEAEVADLEDEVEECGDECADVSELNELEAARRDAQDQIGDERAAIVELCGGEECESLSSSSTTPWLFVVLLGLAAVATVGGLTRTLLRRQS